jgi:hypothetical protein
MAGRIRSIKPEILEDEVMAALSDAAWRCLQSLTVLADDHGNVRLGEKYVAAMVWQDTARPTAATIRELVEGRHIEPYMKSDQRYGHIRGWERHQRIDNAGKPRVPGPSEDDGGDEQWFREYRRRFAETRGETKADTPRLAAARADSPRASARAPAPARAHSGRRINDTDHDHDHDPDQDRAPARARDETPPKGEPSQEKTPPIPDPTQAVDDLAILGQAIGQVFGSEPDLAGSWSEQQAWAKVLAKPVGRREGDERRACLTHMGTHWARWLKSRGSTPSHFKLREWLNAGEPPPQAKGTKPEEAPPAPYHGPPRPMLDKPSDVELAARAKRDAAEREQRAREHAASKRPKTEPTKLGGDPKPSNGQPRETPPTLVARTSPGEDFASALDPGDRALLETAHAAAAARARST